MTNLLIRLFVPNFKNPHTPATRARFGLLSSVVSITLNAVLFAVRLTCGLLMGSVAVIADAVHGLTDGITDIISLFSFKIAAKPADKEHPFGHGRTEYLATLSIAAITLFTAVQFLKLSIDKIMHPAPLNFNLWTTLALLAVVVVKLWCMFFFKNIARRINSATLNAMALEARNDILVTGFAIVSVLVSQATGLHLDGFTGVVIALFVFKSGIEMTRTAFSPLLGERVNPNLSKQIKEHILSHSDVLGLHDLIVHNYGPSHMMATIHAEFDGARTLLDIHEIIDTLEQTALKQLRIHLLIHADPVTQDNAVLNAMKALVIPLVSVQNAEAHDFRLITTQTHQTLLFDLIVPCDIPKSKHKTLAQSIKTHIASNYPNTQTVIHITHSFSN